MVASPSPRFAFGVLLASGPRAAAGGQDALFERVADRAIRITCPTPPEGWVYTVTQIYRDAPLPGQTELVPGVDSVLVGFNPRRTTGRIFLRQLQKQYNRKIETNSLRASSDADTVGHKDKGPLEPARVRWVLPLWLEGVHLPELCRALACSIEQIKTDLTKQELEVKMLGFAPGFAYLGSLGPRYNIPRREGLSPILPPGTILLAVQMLGLTATPTTSGWWVLGRTSFLNFYPHQNPPSRLSPGDKVQFEIHPLQPS